VIWRALNEYFIDIKPYFANEIPLHFPVMAPPGYTVDNKLVAMAYRAEHRASVLSPTTFCDQSGYS